MGYVKFNTLKVTLIKCTYIILVIFVFDMYLQIIFFYHRAFQNKSINVTNSVFFDTPANANTIKCIKTTSRS